VVLAVQWPVVRERISNHHKQDYQYPAALAAVVAPLVQVAV
jgi:hypothetical protein